MAPSPSPPSSSSADPIDQVKAHLGAASIASPDNATLEALLAVNGGDARTAARMVIDDHKVSNPSAVPRQTPSNSTGLRRRAPRVQMEFAENEGEYEALVRWDDHPISGRHVRPRRSAGNGEGSETLSVLYGALSLPFSLLQSLILGIARILRFPALLAKVLPWLKESSNFDEEAERRGVPASIQFQQELVKAKEVPQEANRDSNSPDAAPSELRGTPRIITESYNNALKAAKNDLKVLVIMMTSGSQRDEDKKALRSFVSDQVISVLSQEDFLVWGAFTRRKEGHAVARQLRISKTPSVVCVALRPSIGESGLATATAVGSSPRLSLVSRVGGFASQSPDLLADHLRNSLARCSSFLEGLRAERVARETERRLMAEQDRAYEEASRRDAQKVAQRKAEVLRLQQEEIARQDMERQRLEELQKRIAWKRWVQRHVLPTTEVTDSQAGARISAVLPDGRRIMRMFDRHAPAEHLYMWIESSSLGDGDHADQAAAKPEGYEHVYGFSLFFGYPRQRLGPEALSGGTVRLCDVEGLCPRANVIVEGTINAVEGGLGEDSGSGSSDGEEHDEAEDEG